MPVFLPYPENKRMNTTNEIAIKYLDDMKPKYTIQILNLTINAGIKHFCLYNTRGLAHLDLYELEKSLVDFNKAINDDLDDGIHIAELLSRGYNPAEVEVEMKYHHLKMGAIHSNKAIVLTAMGRDHSAISEYMDALELGFRTKEVIDEVVNLCKYNNLANLIKYFKKDY